MYILWAANRLTKWLLFLYYSCASSFTLTPSILHANSYSWAQWTHLHVIHHLFNWNVLPALHIHVLNISCGECVCSSYRMCVIWSMAIWKLKQENADWKTQLKTTWDFVKFQCSINQFMCCITNRLHIQYWALSNCYILGYKYKA